MIIEATSGNTGIAFSAIGRLLGHNVTIFMPDWMSEERKNLIRSFGANIELISKEQGGFLGSISMAEELAEKEEKSFLPCQFSNEDNVEAHYLTTGPEIWWQLQSQGLSPDAIVAGVRTGGTIMGIGKHRIQGISDDFIPPILKLDKLDEVVSVDDGDAIIMAQKLASALGLGVGISSGANLLGAIKVQNQLVSKSIVVTVFSDDNKKYLSSDFKTNALQPYYSVILYSSNK